MLKKRFALLIFFCLAALSVFSEESQSESGEFSGLGKQPEFSFSEPEKKSKSGEKNSFIGKSIFSFDLGYLGTGLKNNGWGFGISYEHSIFDYSAIKGNFSHMTMFAKNIETRVTTVGIRLEALFYPFGSGLDKLYLGFGGGTDFLMYIDKESEDSKDTIITVYPEIGWKQNFMNYVMVDVFFGYRILMNEPLLFSWQADLVDSGVEYGVRIKFNLKEIWSFVKTIFRRNGQNAMNENAMNENAAN